MDTHLTAIKHSITMASGNLQKEIQTASQAQATQEAVAIPKEIPGINLLIAKLQRTAEWQVANDPGATPKSTGLPNSHLKGIQAPLSGMPLGDFDAVMQRRLDLGKRPRLDDFRAANPNAPPKSERKSRLKEAQAKIAQLELKMSELESKLDDVQTENKDLREENKQLRLGFWVGSALDNSHPSR